MCSLSLLYPLLYRTPPDLIELEFTVKEMATTPVRFLKEVRDELTQVTWPTQQEVVRLTVLVLAISVVVGIYIGALDFIFTKAIEAIIARA